MKKTVLGLLAGATLFFCSCGEKLYTPEQVSAKIEEGFNAQKSAVETEENAKCDAAFEGRVEAEVQRMTEDARVIKEAEEAAAKAANPKKK